MIEVHHAASDLSGVFQAPEGTTDASAVGEVWILDTYRIGPDDVSDRVVVDIGASVGAFAVLAAKMGARRVVAYEPRSEAYQALVSNCALNEVVVEARQVAVMGTAGSVQIEGESAGSHAVPAERGTPSVTLEAVLDDLGPVDLLKMDCEGAEFAIFAALPEERLSEIAHIVMEVHGPLMPQPWLDADGKHLERWGAMVAKLAAKGTLEIVCRPMVGGLIRWTRW